jgi:hypothetical protein
MPTQFYENWHDFIVALDGLLNEQLPAISQDATPVLLQVEARSPQNLSMPPSEYSWPDATEEIRRKIQEFAEGEIQITLHAANVVAVMSWFCTSDSSCGTIETRQ